MRKKKWKKRVASMVLAAVMVVSQIGVWNAGGTQVNAATGSWVDTNLVTNGDFETKEPDTVPGWIIDMPTANNDTNGYKIANWGENNYFNFWSNGEARSFSMKQVISNVEPGTYRLAFKQEGEDALSGLTISVNDVSLTQSKTTGYNNWASVQTESFILQGTGNVTITISGNINAGYWGDLDNFVLQKYSEEAQSTTVTSFIDDFNDNKTEGWNPIWTSGSGTFEAKKKDSPFENSALNIYSESEQILTASYVVSNVEAGTYAVSMKSAGESLSATVKVSGDGVSETTETLTFGKWNFPEVNKTSSFTVSKTTDLTI